MSRVVWMLMFAGFIAAVALAPEVADAALIAVATIFIGAASIFDLSGRLPSGASRRNSIF